MLEHFQYATDEDYAVIDATKSSVDSLNGGNAQLGTNTGATIQLAQGVTYLIGSTPKDFGQYNMDGKSLSSLAGSASSSTFFGIYAVNTSAAGTKPEANLVAVVNGITLDSNPSGSDLHLYTLNSQTADGNNGIGHLGGTSYVDQFNAGSVNPSDLQISQLNDAESFLGMGAFYNLAGTNFETQHIQYV